MGINTIPTSKEQSISDTKPILTGLSTQAVLSDTQPINPTKTSFGAESTLAIYRCKKNSRGFRLFWMLVGILCVLGPLAYTTWSYSNFLNSFGLSPAIQWSYPWILISCFFLALYSLFVFWRFLITESSIKLYEDKIVIKQRPFRSDVIPLKNIMGIATNSTQERLFGLPIINRFTIHLKISEGHFIKIGSPLCSLPELATQLKEKVYPLIFPFIQGDYRLSKWIPFGAVSLNQNSIKIYNQILPLEAVAGIELDSGFLIVSYHQIGSTKKNKVVQKKIPTARIFNLELFYQLIQSGGS